MLRAAILTLLKAGGGQQLGLFGAHVPPASPSSSGAQEQIVHVKEHTRQTSHGVQVVAAHDVRRARATPATPAAAPNPRTRAGQDAAAEAAQHEEQRAATQQKGVNSEHTRRLRVGAQQRAEAHRRIATAARLHVAAANGAERGR